ncbi:Hpt domain-containing protein [Vibrio sonorensis]|uniref:Hpt domain-containing protein n=1 Tax=Vibrio sonorensis TaxID=1004316 RepID=UPI000B1B7DC0|nr:Hpt domain-containing protein [Vibrio sonorensis]
MEEKQTTEIIDERLVDESVIQQVIEDTCAEVLPELIDHYLSESALRIDKIIHAIDQKDAPTLEFETHTLGSSALALGNRPLSNLARKIEHLCLDGMNDEAYALRDDLIELAKASLAAIKMRKQQGFQ